MFMHISPEINMYGETISTLKFASRVSEITLGQVGAEAGVRARARVCVAVCKSGGWECRW